MKGLLVGVSALFFIFAAPLHAETYKWVDAKGVTNYSSAPPPSASAARAQVVVEERVSIVESDASIGPAIAAMRARAARSAEFAEAEWLQRQRIMANAPLDYDGALSPYDYGYAPLFVRGVVRPLPVRVYRTAHSGSHFARRPARRIFH